METIFCHSCGTKISINSTFCTDCGTKQKIDISEVKNINESNDSNIKPFYLKPWFIIFMLFMLLVIYQSLTKEKEVFDGRQFVPQSQYEKEIRNR